MEQIDQEAKKQQQEVLTKGKTVNQYIKVKIYKDKIESLEN